MRVFNLEFPMGCGFFDLCGYRFQRVKDYEKAIRTLPHLSSYFSEFPVKPQTGDHAVTADVALPRRQENAVMEWAGHNPTALDDLCLLLSLFTGRNVFVPDDREQGITLHHARPYVAGGILRCSLPCYADPGPPPHSYGNSFKAGLEDIYRRIRTEQWRRKYRDGYFLFLARSAFQQHTLEARFTQCWTIWEHFFSVLNEPWFSDDQIRRVEAAEKIGFLLVKYGLKREITGDQRKRLRTLAEIRNRLIHFGRLPDGAVAKHTVLLVDLTEHLIAKALGLAPKDPHDSLRKLEQFLDGKPAAQRWRTTHGGG